MAKKDKKTKREKHEKKQSIFKEFTAFINKGNAVALAIGVVLGSAFTAIVNAANNFIISPLIAFLIGDADLSESLITVLKWTTDPDTGEKIAAISIKWGAFIQAVIDFLLIALILFIISKITSRFMKSVDDISKTAKAKIEAKLEKEFEKEEAELAAKNKEDAPAEEAVEEVAPVEEAAPVQEVAPVVEAAPAVDETALLLKEIRDLLKKQVAPQEEVTSKPEE